MKRTLTIVIGLIVIVVVAGVALMATKPSTKSAADSSNAPASTPASSSKQAAAVITYTSSGFSPAQTAIKSGGSVTFTNQTSEEIQVDSNPHPVHTDDPDLNVGTIAPGASATATLTKTGTFGFHNHLNPGDTAKITIE
ncbi:MAG TPA: cupredoxin domain-containing protein [Candidatus Saccharimonadia bacterium]|jgi:plastocyanin